jgi:drug/metabolite transporter (DMT)-like permease
MVVAVIAALASALCYAAASVLQRQSAEQAPTELSLRPALLLDLVRRPRWLLGIVGDIAGFALEFVALANGPLVVVQPLAVSGLLFALPLAALVEGKRMSRAQWLAAVQVVLGLSVFLVIADPSGGRSTMSGLGWVIVFCLTLGPSAVLMACAGPRGPRRATMLAMATGLVYGLTAALTKAAAYRLEGGPAHFFTSWETYALLVIGLTSVILSQSAFQAGPLASSLPVLAVLEPLVGIAIGTLAFEEAIHLGGILPGLELAGLVLMVAGAWRLAATEISPDVPEAAPG